MDTILDIQLWIVILGIGTVAYALWRIVEELERMNDREDERIRDRVEMQEFLSESESEERQENGAESCPL